MKCTHCGGKCQPQDRLTDGRYLCDKCARAKSVWLPTRKQPRLPV